MRVRDLRALLDEVRGIFVSAGARSQEKALSDVGDALTSFDDEDINTYLERVRRTAEAATAPPEDQYLKLLAEAGMDEQRFLAALDRLSTDRKIKKAGLHKVARGFAGTVSRNATAAQLVDAIKLAFYKKLYERDAREMARRAKPV